MRRAGARKQRFARHFEATGTEAQSRRPATSERPVSVVQATCPILEAFVDQSLSHNAFNVLFTLAFFATFALMIVRFG